MKNVQCFKSFLFILNVLIFTLIGGLHGEPNGQSNLTIGDKTITDDTIKKLMEKLSEFLGSSQSLSNNSISYNEGNQVLQASVLNGIIKDPGTFSIKDARVNMSSLEFFIGTFHNSLGLYGLYDILFDNEYIHLTGSDTFSISCTSLSTHLYLKLNVTAQKTLQVEDLKLDYNTTINVEFKNLGHSQKVSDRLNSLMNYLLPVAIASTKEQVNDEVKKEAFPKIQFLIGGMTVDQLIELLNSIVDTSVNDDSIRKRFNCLFSGNCKS